MSGRYTGGCQCGAVRYSIDATPRMIYACHCTQCQRVSGAAFAMACLFAAQSFEMTGVQPNFYVREGKGGRKVRCSFCPKCGSRINNQWFTEQGDIPFVSLRPGTLDDTSWVRPDFHIWAQHRQPWIRFSAEDVVYEQAMPVERMRPFFQGQSA
ncbi:MAG: GFA family protein [Burkholderiaceae bacterium]